MKWPQWLHRLGTPRHFFAMTTPAVPWLAVASVLLLGTGSVWGLAFAPPDYQQGNSFRIMYVHVPAAIVASHCYVMMAVAGLVLLVWRIKLSDLVIRAAAPIGASITALALFSGAVWGRPTWGAWWVWDARTTSVVVQLFLYFGVIALRHAFAEDARYGADDRGGRAAAVLCLVGAVNIPIIKYSVDWWLTLHQTSTFRLTEAPSMPPEMYLPLLVNVLGFYCVFALALILALRADIVLHERRTQWLRDYSATRGAGVAAAAAGGSR